MPVSTDPQLQHRVISDDTVAGHAIARPVARGWNDVRVWLGITAIAIVLAPAALFPPGSDAALYYVSGQKILHQGAAHYRDIVDVKPPLIYHLYAGAAAIFGSNLSSFRILDYLLQLSTALGIAGLVAGFSNRRRGLLAGLIYAVFYCAQSYNGTAITESYVGLLSVPMIALQLRRRSVIDFLAIGALAGALFLLKFSLVTPLAASLAAEVMLFNDAPARRLRNVGLVIGGFLVIAAALPLYLALTDGWDGFAQMNTFIAGYVANQSSGLLAGLREALTQLPAYFADEFSLAMLVATAAGVMISFRRLAGEDREDRQTRVIALATLNGMLMLAAVVIEAKYRAFHLSRLLPFAAILSACGFAWMLERVRREWPLGSFGRFALVILVPAAFVFSPIPRYVRHGAGAVVWVTQGDAGFDRLYYFDGLGYSFGNLRAVGDHIKRTRRAGDEMFVSASVGGLVHAFADDVPASRIYHSAFLIAPYAPEVWRAETRRFLLDRVPRYVVVQRGDSMVEMTGTPLSSEQVLRTLPGVDSLLRGAYDTVVTTYRFELYERRRK